ncbi:FprA family A-type flavoprotein [Methanolobus halotolerans]|uniref:MBL fold metallo-hydrolase n=1 Tax=Methanolobus halotolerans TaxID=2052935 RepID=A0A4E0PZI6_9EURY|nr:FprA family A-type flavoprotein [Methanolobus halotolerans]TGC11053.1 MBL fold metallo-hydrolase [Methanolobus halotolerans]
MDDYEPLKVAEGIYWVGVVDWNLRDFHGYETPKGGSYNAYLVVDEKIALIDTVKAPFAEEMIKRISQIVDLSKIDYVISNHVEMDHSSSISKIMQIAPKAKLFASSKGKAGLYEHYKEEGFEDWDLQVVGTGDELNLGKRTLMFIEATMLHWPDSMQTYVREDKILFSNDAFGQHIATSKRFDDEVEDVMEDAAIYYANILLPFSSQVLKYVEKLGELGIGTDIMIAPAHGVIWRKDPAGVIGAYSRWAKGGSSQKVLVIYDTMWGSTEKMAKEIVEGVQSAGVEVRLRHLRKNDWSMTMKEIMESSVIAIGSPTMNNKMFYTVSGFLTYITGLRPKGKKFFLFGSYGWGGGAVKGMEKELGSARFDMPEESLQVKFRPFEEDLEQCKTVGIKLAELAKQEANY